MDGCIDSHRRNMVPVESGWMNGKSAGFVYVPYPARLRGQNMVPLTRTLSCATQ